MEEEEWTDHDWAKFQAEMQALNRYQRSMLGPPTQPVVGEVWGISIVVNATVPDGVESGSVAVNIGEGE